MHSEQLEVLNISNINAKGQTVLNDEKLLEFIQQYPFLYNPDLLQYNDSDYVEWAWTSIAKELNKTYNNPSDKQLFPVPALINRWRLLQPIILSLSKSYDINAIPSNFRQHVVNLSSHLEKERPDVKPQPYSSAQNIVLENIEMVERLPLEYRKQLETEMMSILLKTELELKGTAVANALEVELECKNILQEIGIKYHCEYLNGKKLNVNANWPNMVAIPGNTDLLPAVSHTDIGHSPFVELKEDKAANGQESEEIQWAQREEMEQLLVPLDRPQWIPLDQAPFHVRKCVVRVKRLQFILPDDLPIKRVKKENCFML